MITTEGKIKQNFYFESWSDFDNLLWLRHFWQGWLDINE